MTVRAPAPGAAGLAAGRDRGGGAGRGLAGERRPQVRGGGRPAGGNGLGRPLRNDPAALLPGAGADLEEPVRGLEDVEVVLDHDDAVAAVDQRLQDPEEDR